MSNYYYTNYQSPEYRSVAGSADAPQPAAVRVESVAFPGVYLCMGGTVAEFDMDGAGWAACEYGAQSVLLSVQTGPAADVVALAYNAVLPVVASDLSPAIRNT